MNAPQVIMTVMLSLQFFYHARNDKELSDYFATIVGTGIWVSLLVWGGFFK